VKKSFASGWKSYQQTESMTIFSGRKRLRQFCFHRAQRTSAQKPRRACALVAWIALHGPRREKRAGPRFAAQIARMVKTARFPVDIVGA
jgi:hypothetical protein